MTSPSSPPTLSCPAHGDGVAAVVPVGLVGGGLCLRWPPGSWGCADCIAELECVIEAQAADAVLSRALAHLRASEARSPEVLRREQALTEQEASVARERLALLTRQRVEIEARLEVARETLDAALDAVVRAAGAVATEEEARAQARGAAAQAVEAAERAWKAVPRALRQGFREGGLGREARALLEGGHE